MKREIRFRAWSKLYKKFESYSLEQIINQKVNLWFLRESPVMQQYTGLKDKNGKEIYEGDIIKLGGRHYEIVFSDYAASFMRETPTGYLRYSLNEYECGEDFEIIGNVFENRELLQ